MATLGTTTKISATTNLIAMLVSEQVAESIGTVFALTALLLGSKVKMFRTRKNNFINLTNRLMLYARDGFACFYCGSTSDLSLDHIVPQHERHDHSFENLITCCRSCNSSKKHQPLTTWLSKQTIIGKTNKAAKQVIEQAKKACV